MKRLVQIWFSLLVLLFSIAARANYPWASIKHRGDIKEGAAMISFLLSPDAPYISGQIISINNAMA